MAMMLETMGPFLTELSIVGAVVTFFLGFFHYRFANSIQQAMRTDDQTSFESAWRNLRYHFRLYGIMIIAYIAIYLIAIVFFVSMVSSAPDF